MYELDESVGGERGAPTLHKEFRPTVARTGIRDFISMELDRAPETKQPTGSRRPMGMIRILKVMDPYGRCEPDGFVWASGVRSRRSPLVRLSIDPYPTARTRFVSQDLPVLHLQAERRPAPSGLQTRLLASP